MSRRLAWLVSKYLYILGLNEVLRIHFVRNMNVVSLLGTYLLFITFQPITTEYFEIDLS